MKDLTPATMKCALSISSPSVHEITPAELQCPYADCPSVHAIANSGNLIIVGKRLPPEFQAQMAGKVGDDEYAIIIDRALLANVDPFPSNYKAPDNPYEGIDENYAKPDVISVPL